MKTNGLVDPAVTVAQVGGLGVTFGYLSGARSIRTKHTHRGGSRGIRKSFRKLCMPKSNAVARHLQAYGLRVMQKSRVCQHLRGAESRDDDLSGIQTMDPWVKKWEKTR
jgi:hypothetical protein